MGSKDDLSDEWETDEVLIVITYSFPSGLRDLLLLY